ncbi:arsenate reductase (glutaredoxin) [Amphritea opalescens]|uniref:Arsenate reductase n=1 Tax=Amphritea opalescens TaxID=2490544 RepID=A0A430KSH2_9GAMM|nr:arsenate reductase (glutaredoxin) [Amphritea opalescens]RTE66462.1 arsenate reductase (glutaredoxin) [Amphritea opalescens]
MSVEIYHNPRCSKSRATLALLEENGVTPDIRLYLENPPTEAQLADVISQLGITPRELLRKGEAEYKENNLNDDSLSDQQIIALMVQFPRLIERPIVITNGKARIGRPPEAVLEIL